MRVHCGPVSHDCARKIAISRTEEQPKLPPRLYCLLEQDVGLAVQAPRSPRANGWARQPVPGQLPRLHGASQDRGIGASILRPLDVGRKEKEPFEELV